MKNKKAIFVCGSGGSGKSSFIKNNLAEYEHIDVDIIYEKLLIDNNMGLKIKNFNKDELIKSSILFEESKSKNDYNLACAIQSNKNIVIDGIGRYSDIILSQRSYLEQNGYSTFMLMIYADLNTCLERVRSRERDYGEFLVKDSWYLSYNNVGTYKKEFGDRFLFIYNDYPIDCIVLNSFLDATKELKRLM